MVRWIRLWLMAVGALPSNSDLQVDWGGLFPMRGLRQEIFSNF
jgi:hypothetical protein